VVFVEASLEVERLATEKRGIPAVNQDLGLRLLGQIMAWSDERARDEFQWIRLMSRLKYDGYEAFRAGARFVESLCVWLQQFKQADREAAYSFIREKLMYISPAEMQILVDRFYPDIVERHLVSTVALQKSIPRYRVWSDSEAADELWRARRSMLFMGLSDGARIDEFRRANTGILSNEQIVVATQLDVSKWRDLLKKLSQDLEQEDSVFGAIYLIDDFVGSGTSMLRQDPETKKWDGKLIRFRRTLDDAQQVLSPRLLLVSDWRLNVHHYVATAVAEAALRARIDQAATYEALSWLANVDLSFGTVLPDSLKISENDTDPFSALVPHYYDPSIENQHSELSGEKSMMWGYRKCGLPLVFEHNTPNNSLPILWAGTKGDAATGVHSMRPLFPRRQRHS
jgi:hypothetical protein